MAKSISRQLAADYDTTGTAVIQDAKSKNLTKAKQDLAAGFKQAETDGGPGSFGAYSEALVQEAEVAHLDTGTLQQLLLEDPPSASELDAAFQMPEDNLESH